MSISGGTDYTAGSVIEYTAFGEITRRVRVETADPDIKNGRPGFEGTVVSSSDPGDFEFIRANGGVSWGYDSQVTRVVSR